MHKTLPALTQSALLHICSDRVSYEEVITSLRMIQTSSPSYIMMGIMDYVRDYIINNIDRINERYIKSLKQIRKRLIDELNYLDVIEYQSEYYDMSKIVISTQKTNINGYELADILYKEYSIIIEAALEGYIIIMTTMADDASSLSTMQKALTEIDKKLKGSEQQETSRVLSIAEISTGEDPRKVFYGHKEWLDIEESMNKVVSKNIMLYPPGIPIVAIGEKINEENKALIIKHIDKLQGIKRLDNKLLIEVIQ